MIVVPAAKNAASKNYPKDILRKEKHLDRIQYQSILHRMMCLKQEKSSDGWILIVLKLLNSKLCLTALLPDHILKPRHQMKPYKGANLCHNSKLTSDMYLLEFRQVWGLCTSLFFLSSIRHFFCM